jgi:steroid delta-isomerase-like uncharacterized protein
MDEGKGGVNMATDVERVYKDYLAAKNSHDVAKIAALWTEDSVDDDVASGQVTHGKKELKASFSDIFAAFPNVKWELKSLFSAGDRIAVEWVETGTQTGDWAGIPATGKSYSIRGASLMEVREGKISRLTSYWNMADFLQQLGLMPKTPSK